MMRLQLYMLSCIELGAATVIAMPPAKALKAVTINTAIAYIDEQKRR